MLVGVTGNIGSGKTTVCELFSKLGIPVYYADDRAKLFLNTPEVIDELVSIFGHDILTKEKQIDRQRLAGKVFHDEVKLGQLNAIIHPRVKDDFQRWATEQTHAPYVIQEAAILIESGHYQNMDKIILVRAPEHVRIRRVSERDHVDDHDVRQRAKHQMPEKEKVKFADFIITNDSRKALVPQVNDIHQKLVRSC